MPRFAESHKAPARMTNGPTGTVTATARPHLEGSDLIVNGRRFVVLGAETHNSSSSTPEAIAAAFARVRELGANTVLAPVAWDLFEPEEGVFDVTLVDEMLAVCRREGLRLIPLWFGAWKNGQSTYAPSWVKRNTARFPRAHISGQGATEHLSPFGLETTNADTAAFRALMAHLNTVSAEDVVAMVQVENEVGLLGDSRDRSDLAEAAWADEMPASVIAAIGAAPRMPAHEEWLTAGAKGAGSWGDVLGESPIAHEAFMAHAYASHIETVTSAGRPLFPIPLFVNAWLNNPPGEGYAADVAGPDGTETVALAGGGQPGTYPSGGPLPRVAPVWIAAAPSLDFLAPDVYFGDPAAIFEEFRQLQSRLFIPEMRRSSDGVGQMFLAIGQHRAIGVSPFGVDSIRPGDRDEAALRDAYTLLAHAGRLVSAAPAAATHGFLLDETDATAEFEFGDFLVTVDCLDPFGLFPPSLPSYGMLIAGNDGEITAVGRGFHLAFHRRDEQKVGIISAHELTEDVHGITRVVRKWNGDETSGGVRVPPLNAEPASAFPIPMMISSTGVVRVTLYTFDG